MTETTKDTTAETITPTPDTIPQKKRIYKKPIPLEITFTGDPRGHGENLNKAIAHKTIIYKLLREDLVKGLSPKEIVQRANQRIQDEAIDIEPITLSQITGYMIGMNSEIAQYGIFVEKTNKKGLTVYRLQRLEESQATQKPTEKIEDTEIDKVEYMRRIRLSLPEGTSAAAIAIAEHPGIGIEGLKDKIQTSNLSSILERLNEAGSSGEFPQEFRAEIRKEKTPYGKNVYRYYLLVFKGKKKEKQSTTYQPQEIPELSKVDTRMVFAIKAKVQELTRQIIGSSDREIESRIRDINHTLGLISKTPEIERITSPIREKIDSILRQYEKSIPKTFSPALREALKNIR